MERRFHLSYDGRWVPQKNELPSDTPLADAQLVASALIESEQRPTAILTMKTSIINLLRNALESSGDIPFSPSGIVLYFPSRTEWYPHLRVQQEYPTNHTAEFARGEE